MGRIKAPDIYERQIYRANAFPAWLLLDTCFREHHSLPHASPGWIVLAAWDGLEEFSIYNQRWTVRPQTILTIPPGVMHANRAGWQVPCRVQVLYLPPQLALPLAGGYSQEAWIFAAWERFVAAFVSNRVEGTYCWQHFIGGFQCGQASVAWQTGRLFASQQRTAMPVFGHWHDVPDLPTLTQRWGKSKASVLRIFRQIWGCSPDEYRRFLQVQAAAQSILRGAALAEAALEAGFWDQSHLHRHFVGIYGMTPAQFRQQWQQTQETQNLVQDLLL